MKSFAPQASRDGLRRALAVALLAFGGCLAIAGPANLSRAKDPVVANAEDMAPLPGDQWVIASSMGHKLEGPGALVAVDARDGSVRRLYPLRVSAKAGSAPSTASGCPGPLAGDFGPHGIVLRPQRNGSPRLYVVNHGGRESVEVFDVLQHKSGPELRWRDCLPAPRGSYNNAVAVADDGTVFVTNMASPLDGSPAPTPYGGDVLVWQAGSGWRPLPGAVLPSPNGLLLSADGRRLYVASWFTGQLIELTLQGSGAELKVASQRSLALGLLPDNLRQGRDGRILATGHLSPAEAVVSCYTSTEPCAQTIRAAIAVVDPLAWTKLCQRDVTLGNATVAVPVGDQTWVGTVRGDRIERLAAGALEGEACK